MNECLLRVSQYLVKKINKDKARKGDETYSIHIKSRYLNAIEFGAKQTKKGVSAKIWNNKKIGYGAIARSYGDARSLTKGPSDLRTHQ